MNISYNFPVLKNESIKLGIYLNNEQIQQLYYYYDQLVTWNQKFNLTSITDIHEVETKHFLDSLTCSVAFTEDMSGGRSLIDVGSGAGFPGIVLKIAFPELSVALLEATAKKCSFLSHVCNTLNLADIEVVNGRAEEVAHKQQYRGKFDFVVARAVSELPVLLEYCTPFLKVKGKFLAPKKGDIQQEVERAQKAAPLLGSSLKQIHTLSGLNFGDKRVIIEFEQKQLTTSTYPRPSGKPVKKPLA